MPSQKEKKAKTSLKQQAYDYIKEKILNCEYNPNEFINELLLCEEMGNMSRTPVRDALNRLEQEGLVRIFPKKGTFVAELKLSDINRIYEVRMLLEPHALQKYGSRLKKEDLLHFQKLFEANVQDHLNDRDFYQLDDRFHAMIIDAVDNQYLQNTYRNITDLNQRFRVLSGKNNAVRMEETFQEHRSIIEACLKEDWQEAARLMNLHLEISRKAAFHLIICHEQEGPLL